MKILILITLLLPLSLLAETGTYKGVGYTLEPIFGRQKVTLSSDASHVATQAYYGVRASANYLFLNLEAIYTKTDRGQFLAEDVSNSSGYEIERFKLGLFGSYQVLPMILGIVRGGADAKRITRFTVVDGVISKTTTDPKLSPYLGVGLELGPRFCALTLGLTTVFQGIPDDLEDNDYQFSFGFKLRI